MPAVTTASRPAPVPRCTLGHTTYRAGCDLCRRSDAYYRRLRTWEKNHGFGDVKVPTEEVRAHLQYLINDGNRTTPDIAAETGVHPCVVRKILRGATQHVMSVNATSLLAAKPAAQRQPLRKTLVPAVEAIRLVRGLTAQGWPYRHQAHAVGIKARGGSIRELGAGTRTYVRSIRELGAGTRTYVSRDLLDWLKQAARELGPYDIDTLPEPMPGMDRRTRAGAARKGWPKLGEWDGVDIADPNAEPLSGKCALATEPDDEPTEAMPYVDSVIALRVRLAAERIAVTTPNLSRRTEGFIDPIGNLTRLEMHVATHLASIYGMALTQTAVLLGYPHTTNEEIGNAQRIVSRVNVIAAQAYAAIEHHPTGWTPSWFPFGRFVGFASRLPGLIALLPEPYGFGWTLADFVERLGITEDEARRFLARAVPAGDAAWTPPRRNAIPTGQLVAA